MWETALVFYFVFGAANYLLRRVLAQKLPEHNRLINAVFFLFFLLPTGLVLAAFFPHDLHVSAYALALLLGGSLIWPLYYIAAFSANKYVDTGTFAVINNISPLFTLMVALPFLGESPTYVQYIGIALLVLSGVVATASQFGGVRLSSMRGIWLSVLTAATLGFAVAYERYMLDLVDFGTYIIYGWGAQIAWSLVLTGRDLKNLPSLFSKEGGARSALIAWGASSALRSVAFIIALSLTSASLMSAASDFMAVAVIIAAFIFLGERTHLVYKGVAATVGIAGLLLIAT